LTNSAIVEAKKNGVKLRASALNTKQIPGKGGKGSLDGGYEIIVDT
jgi:hypothetical protein